MNGAIPPLPNTPSWRGAQLKHRDNFMCSDLVDMIDHIKRITLFKIICKNVFIIG